MGYTWCSPTSRRWRLPMRNSPTSRRPPVWACGIAQRFVVGFLCSAGGRASYMSVMAMANSLMLDFRCVIVPRFVYATGDDFSADRTEAMAISSDEVTERLDELAAEVVRLATA